MLWTSRIIIASSLPPPQFIKGGGARFQPRHVNGGIFSEILVGRTKRGDSIFCGSSVGEICQGWSDFPWSVAKITFPDPHFTEHKFSYSCYVIIDHHVIHIFYILLASFQQHNILKPPSYFYYTQYGGMWAYFWKVN